MLFSPAHKVLESPSGPQAAIAFLRSHTSAVLLIDGEARNRKFVPDPLSGAPVSAADPWMLDAASHTFCIPDDSAGGLQLMVHPQVLDPHTHVASDRYLAYHGDLTSARLVLWTIEAGKGGGKVVEGPALSVPNPLAATEFKLLKILNTALTPFAAATQKVLAKVWADPRAVGIDPWGIDIHSRFGMTRINFGVPVNDATAPAAIAELLSLGEP